MCTFNSSCPSDTTWHHEFYHIIFTNWTLENKLFQKFYQRTQKVFQFDACKSICKMSCHFIEALTHGGRVTHICVNKLTIIGSDNGLSPGRHQAIIWTSAEILLIGLLGTNFSEILIRIQIFPFKKIRLKMSSAKWRPFVSASMC